MDKNDKKKRKCLFPLSIDDDYRQKLRALSAPLGTDGATGTIKGAIDDCVGRYVPVDVQKCVGIKNIINLIRKSVPDIK